MRLQLSLSAEDLPKTSLMGGIPDPFAVVTLVGETGQKPVILGQTEVLSQTASPDWTKLFYVDFEPGHNPMNIIVSIYSSEQKKLPLGSTLWDVGSILAASGSRLAKKIKKDGGVLIAHVEEATSAGTLQFQLRGWDLTNTEGAGVFNKSDPFFELQRWHTHGGGWDAVFRSVAVHDNLSPAWGESFVEVHALCGGQLQQKFRIVVFDFDRNGRHTEMGRVLLTVEELLAAVNETALLDSKNMNLDKAFVLAKSGKEVGRIVVVAAKVTGAVKSDVEPDDPSEPSPEEEEIVAMTQQDQAGDKAEAVLIPPPEQGVLVEEAKMSPVPPIVVPSPVAETDKIELEPYCEEDDIPAPIEINEQGQAVVTGTVNIPESRKKVNYEKFMKGGMAQGRTFLKKHRRLVGRVQGIATRKLIKLIT
jgi:hypothetical protein